MATTKSILLFSVLALTCSCSTTRVGASASSVQNVDRITGAEWSNWGKELAVELLQQPTISRMMSGATSERPLVFTMGDFSVQARDVKFARFQTERLQMSNALRSELVNNSNGLLAISMDITGDRSNLSERDSTIQNLRDGSRGSPEYAQSTAPAYGKLQAPTLAISGVIVPIEVTDEGVFSTDRSVEYQLSLKIIDLTRGFTVFEGLRELPKSKSSFLR